MHFFGIIEINSLWCMINNGYQAIKIKTQRIHRILKIISKMYQIKNWVIVGLWFSAKMECHWAVIFWIGKKNLPKSTFIQKIPFWPSKSLLPLQVLLKQKIEVELIQYQGWREGTTTYIFDNDGQKVENRGEEKRKESSYYYSSRGWNWTDLKKRVRLRAEVMQ